MVFSSQTGANLTTQTKCVEIALLDDEILEDVEYFGVNLTTGVESVEVYIGMMSVMVTDNDYLTVGFKDLEYEVGEEDGVVRVCVEARGEMDRMAPVRVMVNTTAGTATG